MTDWIGTLADFAGVEVHASNETRAAILHAMGFDAATETEARDLLQFLQDEDAQRPVATEVIVLAGQAAEIDLRHPVEWAVEAEGGAAVLANGAASERLQLPALPLGIHRLILKTGSRDWVTWILARPAEAVSVTDRTGADKIWGVTAPLYGLTNQNAAPIGTYDLLADYAAALAAHGADFIGVNPVHAMGHTRPDDVISPYSPSHREFLNAWHIAGTDTPSGGRPDLVDYPAALAMRHKSLTTEFEAFNAYGDAAGFKQFADAGGAGLEAYALFEALADRFGADWPDWPATYKTKDTIALASFSAENRYAIDFYKWSQWRADQGVERAQKRATDAGMRVGLYLDLAVGPRAGGAETWVDGSALASGASLGAPPDALAPSGQCWGLAPLSPALCRAQGYAGFARLLRSVMRHAGMIRIDHILGLMRSFWIPDGASSGAYVSYPFDALLAVVAIESAQSGVIVIGEDLGLVPDGLREKLAASGIYGLDVMQYMRSHDGGFEDMQHARPKAISTFATHDTPTITGFFAAEDAKFRLKLGALDEAACADIARDRDNARSTLGGAEPVDAILGRLAEAQSEIVAVQMDDIAHRPGQQNVPGTVDEYPNWRQKSPFALSNVAASAEFTKLSDVMYSHGRANPRRNGDG